MDDKREAYLLPDGVDSVLDEVKKSFVCPGDGYYADVNNDCKVYHVCQSAMYFNRLQMFQWSFFCGEGTIFDQLSLTCSLPERAVQCKTAPNYFYLNNNIGKEGVPYLTDNIKEKGVPYLIEKDIDIISVRKFLPPDIRVIA
ncbi:uncharacterized protein LOC111086297 [Limulus polyphemus]|uniref:Uncharacterized protein LOC111086297 n=1 Tax=Limulus polyphemus TaxID=6850 RepID=A0ABM1SL60_LIMPO|nr:uncharacterized protein LOC111086297 [Limulus polyphemus]